MFKERSKREQEWRERNNHWLLPLICGWVIVGFMSISIAVHQMDLQEGANFPPALIFNYAWQAFTWPSLALASRKAKRLVLAERAQKEAGNG